MNMISKNQIRALFSTRLSNLYRQEVPQYGTLIKLVNQVNEITLKKNPTLQAALEIPNNLARLSQERHGAIRLGKPEELKAMCALFNIMGMYPVGYYDLSTANIPVHATAFRPLDNTALQANPLRIFTSLLRIDLIQDQEIVKIIQDTLSKREIFSDRLKELISIHEKQSGLTEYQAIEFIDEALNVFRWRQEATISYENYSKLKLAHPLIADIVSFKGPHINHLTPNTLDIDSAQTKIPTFNLDPKAVIEGPPTRNVPILLRQTSFKALEEPITFLQNNDDPVQGKHRARFGEIEQRGAALKPEGLTLFHELMNDVRKQIEPKQDGSNAEAYYTTLERVFKTFPDDLPTLRKENLIYGIYQLTEKGKNIVNFTENADDFEQLIEKGIVTYQPITYEDFLPISAAGIFTSNLSATAFHFFKKRNSQQEFEMALGCKTIDPLRYYENQENNSKKVITSYLAHHNKNDALTSKL